VLVFYFSEVVSKPDKTKIVTKAAQKRVVLALLRLFCLYLSRAGEGTFSILARAPPTPGTVLINYIYLIDSIGLKFSLHPGLVRDIFWLARDALFGKRLQN